MQHAFRGSRRLFAFFSTCALISFAVFAAGALSPRSGQERPSSSWPSPRQRRSDDLQPAVGQHRWPDPQNANLYTLTQLAWDDGQHHQLRWRGPVDLGPGQQGQDQGRRLGVPQPHGLRQRLRAGRRPGRPGRSRAGPAIRTSGPSSAATPTASPTRRSRSTTRHYTLDANNGTNTLHGGFLGWNTAVWSAATSTGPGVASLALTQQLPGRRGMRPPADHDLHRVPGSRSRRPSPTP